MGSFLLPLVKDALRFLLCTNRLAWRDGELSYPGGGGRGWLTMTYRAGWLSLLIVAKVENSNISIAREVTGMFDLFFLIPVRWCVIEYDGNMDNHQTIMRH